MKFVSLLIILIILNISCSHFTFQSVYKDTTTLKKHARGLNSSKFDESLIAVSAKNGVFGLFDLEHLRWIYIDSLACFEDARDIEILKDSSLLLLNSGKKGLIYQVNKNKEGKKLFKQDNLFLDGFSFYPFNKNIGFAYGDPIDSTFVVLKTEDSGNTWKYIESKKLPKILKNEAGFAASGTGIQTPSDGVVYIATGISDTARVFRTFNDGLDWDAVNTPMKSGDTFGIYSMCFSSIDNGFIAGGSYKDTLYNNTICFYTKNKGKTWSNRSKGLPGYMSCVSVNSNETLTIVTGRLGTYYSLNNGKKWKILTENCYYSCIVTDSKIVLSGKNGTFEIINYFF